MLPFSTSRQAGFSLLEVLVAFVILALSLGVLMRLVSTSLGNIARAEHATQAVTVAQSVLARLGTDSPLTEGAQDGEAGAYRWIARVVREGESGMALEGIDAPFLYRIDIEVFLTDSDSNAPLFGLNTLRLVPRP